MQNISDRIRDFYDRQKAINERGFIYDTNQIM